MNRKNRVLVISRLATEYANTSPCDASHQDVINLVNDELVGDYWVEELRPDEEAIVRAITKVLWV